MIRAARADRGCGGHCDPPRYFALAVAWRLFSLGWPGLPIQARLSCRPLELVQEAQAPGGGNSGCTYIFETSTWRMREKEIAFALRFFSSGTSAVISKITAMFLGPLSL